MLQYYQLKHGFKAVLEDWQLAKIRPIFKVVSTNHILQYWHLIVQVDTLAISPTSIITPHFLSINWETVAHQNMSAGRGWGLWEPNPEFQQNIQSYRYNRFLKVGL